jgi:hypothetical protein
MSATTTKPAPTVKIDRLALSLPGFDPTQSERLAALIASHLADAGLTGDIAIPRLQITLTAPDTGIEQIAWRIARAIAGEA